MAAGHRPVRRAAQPGLLPGRPAHAGLRGRHPPGAGLDGPQGIELDRPGDGRLPRPARVCRAAGPHRGRSGRDYRGPGTPGAGPHHHDPGVQGRPGPRHHGRGLPRPARRDAPDRHRRRRAAAGLPAAARPGAPGAGRAGHRPGVPAGRRAAHRRGTGRPLPGAMPPGPRPARGLPAGTPARGGLCLLVQPGRGPGPAVLDGPGTPPSRDRLDQPGARGRRRLAAPHQLPAGDRGRAWRRQNAGTRAPRGRAQHNDDRPGVLPRHRPVGAG